MNLTHSRFSYSTFCFKNPQGIAESATAWTYETNNQIYDVMISHYSPKGEKCEPHFAIRIGNMAWKKDLRQITTIHREIIKFYSLSLTLANTIVRFHKNLVDTADKAEIEADKTRIAVEPTKAKKKTAEEQVQDNLHKITEGMFAALRGSGLSQEEIDAAMNA